MITMTITVHDGKREILEKEREITFEVDNDAWGKGPQAIILRPEWHDTIIYEVMNEVEDHLNQNPEIWANGSGDYENDNDE